MPAKTCSGRVVRVERDERDPGIEAVAQPLADGHRQPGLADPARSGQGHQPDLGPAEQVGDLVDGLLPSDQRGGGQPAAGPSAARAPWLTIAGRAANRSLSSVARSSRTSRPSSVGVLNVR